MTDILNALFGTKENWLVKFCVFLFYMNGDFSIIAFWQYSLIFYFILSAVPIPRPPHPQ